MPRDVAQKQVQMKAVRMAMMYDAFLDQMKMDLEAGFAEDLPAKYSQVKNSN